MEEWTRLEELVNRLIAAHGRSLEECRRLGGELKESRRAERGLDERLSQVLKRVHELEQERAELKRQVAELPDRADVEEARERLRRLLETLDD